MRTMGGYLFWAGGLVKYNKPHLSVDEQIRQLQQRGMLIDDHALASHYLQHLNYYRLAGYWLPFEADHTTHQFKQDTTFAQILSLYVFDRQLRLLVMDAIERIEVSVRTQWAYQMSNKYGTHPHLERRLFKKKWWYAENLQSLQKEIRRSKEPFIYHLKSKYDEDLPPIWATVEIMTLGQLSKWIANMCHGQDRNAIARQYDMDEINLVSFLHHLTTVRNICAHHSRLWNREFTFTFKIPRKRPADLLSVFNLQASRKIYNTLVMSAWLMDKACPENHFRQHLVELLKQHSIDEKAMGFPKQWRELNFWKTGETV